MSKGEQTKQRIIEAAAGVMNRQGWLSTPVSAIMTATRLQKGGVYNHFDGMADLTVQAFDFASGQILSIVRERLSAPGTARQRLYQLLAAFEFVGRRRPPFDAGCPILNAATEADDADDNMRERVANVVSIIIGELEAAIEEGRKSGEFRKELDPRRAAQFLFAAFEGGVMLAGVTRNPGMFSEIKSDLTAIIDRWLVSTGEPE